MAEKRYMPPIKYQVAPKDKPSTDPVIDWEKKAQEMEAKQKYKLAEKELKALDAPPPPPAPIEPGFKITGGLNLGQIDLMEQQRAATAKMEEIQHKYEEQINSLSQDTEHYRDQVTELRLEMMQKQFTLQLETVMKQLANGNNQGSLLQQVESIKAMASALGYSPAAPAVTDASLQLQIMKMQNDAARESREFEWKMKQDEWMREAKLKEIEQNGMVNMEKIKQEREKLNMLATIPEQFGMAFARGLLAGNAPSDNPVANQPAQKPKPRPASQPNDQSQQPAGRAIEAGEGESGEIECEQCHEAITIGPESTEAVCPGCNARYPVRRRVAQSG